MQAFEEISSEEKLPKILKAETTKTVRLAQPQPEQCESQVISVEDNIEGWQEAHKFQEKVR